MSDIHIFGDFLPKATLVCWDQVRNISLVPHVCEVIQTSFRNVTETPHNSNVRATLILPPMC